MANKRNKRHFGVIIADPSKQAANNSYSPPTKYEDIAFWCVECGVRETWTAESQRVYFEEWKKSIYSHGSPRRCRACRKKRREEVAENNRRTAKGLLNKKSKKAKDF